MHTLTLLSLAIATAVLVFGRTSGTQGVSEINEEDPPSIPSPPPSSPPSAGITAPPGVKEYWTNRMQYIQQQHAIITKDLLKSVIEGKTSKEREASFINWFKQLALVMLTEEEEKNDDAAELKSFAMSPNDITYYSKIETPTTVTLNEPPRPIRQNVPSGMKTLVSGDLDQLRTGFSLEGVSKKPQVFMFDGEQGPRSSVYDVFIFSAMCLGFAFMLFALMFLLYKISLYPKEPTKMDYPAYGVTGPTCDASANTNLAKSAHKYQYQHQKQQMTAMEKIGMDTRSVSDHESEEEGDYTVYECPGFATTGNMEVQNPIFDEDATQLQATKVVIVPKA